jgi:hypothetical protein
LESISSPESLLQAGLATAALLVALWSARRSMASDATPRTGEIVWALVAVAVLVGVSAAVRLGGGHGG